MKVHGACHCGNITFEAEVDAGRVTICHCTDCQSLTGTAYRVSVPAAADSFKLVSGRPKTYIKTVDSGARRVLGFCGDCGSPLYAHAVDGAVSYGIRVGALAERDRLIPSKQKWRRSARGWAMSLEHLPSSDTE